MKGFTPNLDGYADPTVDLERHIHRRTQEWVNHWAERDSDDPAAVEAHATRVRQAVLDGIGGIPQRPGGAPGLIVTGTVDLGPGRPTIEKVRFESLPGVIVTGALYRPVGVTAEEPAPAILFGHGHSYEAKAAERYQSACQMFAQAGMTVLAVDPPGQGERILRGDVSKDDRPSWGVGEHLATGMSAWWAGHSLMRWFVADLIAGFDALAALPEVDQTRIGMTGTSGGGTQTSIMMALEPRLAAAAPSTYITSRLAYQRTGQLQDAEQHLLAGTINGVDHGDLLISFAPKPLRVLAAAWDFFVPEGTDESMARAGRAYAALGAESNLSIAWDDTVHAYSPGLQRAATEFFCAALGLPAPTQLDTTPLPPADLQVTRTGQVVTDHPDAVTIADLITGELDRSTTPQDSATWLKDRVFAGRSVPSAAHLRWIGQPDEPHLFWRAESDLWGAGVLLDPESDGTENPTLTVILLPDGSASSDADALLPEPSGGPRLVLDVRGTGALGVRHRSDRPANSLWGQNLKLLTDLLWVGDSLAAGRIFDVCRAIDVLTADREFQRRWPGLGERTRVRLVARGGLPRWHAELAAMIDPRIVEVDHDSVDLGLDATIRSTDWGEGSDAWQAMIPGVAALLPQLDIR